MSLETAKNSYIEHSREIIRSNGEMSSEGYGFIEMFKRKKLAGFKKKLETYYSWLQEHDKMYSEQLRISGAINDVLLRDAQLGIVEKARNLFINSLSNYEKEISNIEGNLNFRLTTGIALIAIALSVVVAFF